MAHLVGIRTHTNTSTYNTNSNKNHVDTDSNIILVPILNSVSGRVFSTLTHDMSSPVVRGFGKAIQRIE